MNGLTKHTAEVFYSNDIEQFLTEEIKKMNGQYLNLLKH